MSIVPLVKNPSWLVNSRLIRSCLHGFQMGKNTFLKGSKPFNIRGLFITWWIKKLLTIEVVLVQPIFSTNVLGRDRKESDNDVN